MKIACDLDGVLFDFTSAFVGVVNSIAPGTIPPGYTPPDWEWSDVLTPALTTVAWAKVRASHNWWLEVPPDLDNLDALCIFKNNHPEVEIYFVTSRVPTAGVTLLRQCRAALDRYMDLTGTSVIPVASGKLKPLVFNAIGIDFSIDDYDQNVLAAQRMCAGGEHWMLRRSWNAHSDLPAVNSLREFLKKVEAVL